jgi:Na+/H+ antiporter NhaD/arsenite permease-like protein
MNDAVVAGAIFVVAYVLIALDRWDRTLIALIGGFLVVLMGVIDQHEAFEAIDLNVILLLVGMMVIASVLAQTGFFSGSRSGPSGCRMGQCGCCSSVIVTAVTSALLDNVTTVVLMTPVTCRLPDG